VQKADGNQSNLLYRFTIVEKVTIKERLRHWGWKNLWNRSVLGQKQKT